MSSGAEQPLAAERLTEDCFVLKTAAQPSPDLSLHLIGLAAAYRLVPDVIEACAGHSTVLVECAPGTASSVMKVPVKVKEQSHGRSHEVPVSYDGEDLAWVAESTGLSPEDVAEVHSADGYLVTMLGSPGFIYLSQVPDRLVLPRLAMPRVRVPAGAVAIGGRQTGIYGLPRPGGWRILGTAKRVPQVSPGDTVRFVPT